MNFRVIHQTRYLYSEPVSLCQNEVKLLPRDLDHQQCAGSRVVVDPSPAAFRERTDFFGNRVCYFSIQQPHRQLTVTVSSHVRITPPEAEPLPGAGQPWEKARDALRTPSTPDIIEAGQFTLDSPLIIVTHDLRDYAEASFFPGRPLPEAVNDLMVRIHKDFEFVPGFTTVATPLSHVLEHKRGVCQDFAQVAIGCLRSLGLAARYVSGYIETLPPPGKERLKGADVSHAWFSAFIPEVGWVDFDPTNNIIPRDQHITTAWGRDYADVSPLKGIIFSGGTHQLTVSVDVERLPDTETGTVPLNP
ncbi:MAG: transglutaminase family protein [Thermodesulfobacteriota bacterium]